jgi:hypothetical protein
MPTKSRRLLCVVQLPGINSSKQARADRSRTFSTHHGRSLRIVHADQGRRAAASAFAYMLPFENDNVAGAAFGQMKCDGCANYTSADDHNVGGPAVDR